RELNDEFAAHESIPGGLQRARDLQMGALLLVGDRHIEVCIPAAVLRHHCQQFRRIEIPDLYIVHRQIRKRVELRTRALSIIAVDLLDRDASSLTSVATVDLL